MAVSPTPGQLVDANDYATERRANYSGAGGRFFVDIRMQIPILVIGPLGLVGNVMVLWLLGFRIRRNPFSVYILNLAGADALFLCCTLLISINRFVGHLDDFRNVTFEIVLYLRYISYIAGLSLLAAISTERCLSALFPIWYRCHRSKHTSAVVCAGLWALATLLWVAVFVICIYVPRYGLCKNVLFIQLLWFFLFTPVLCMSSLTLLLRVQCSSRRRQPPRLYLLVLLTVLVFLLCALPFGFHLYFFGFDIPQWLPQLLACLNSSANPLIYFFLGIKRHKRREPLRVVLQRALGDEQEVGGDAGHPRMPHVSLSSPCQFL